MERAGAATFTKLTKVMKDQAAMKYEMSMQSIMAINWYDYLLCL